jgi:hypothetical protein
LFLTVVKTFLRFTFAYILAKTVSINSFIFAA